MIEEPRDPSLKVITLRESACELFLGVIGAFYIEGLREVRLP